MKECSLFEETLFFTSYRYCIGRKSYVSSFAYELPQHFYHKLSSARRKFTSKDIRKCIEEKLQWLPIKVIIRGSLLETNYLTTLLEFIYQQNIQSEKELLTYTNIVYNPNNKTFTFKRCEAPEKEYFIESTIDALIDWEAFASCFEGKFKYYNNEPYFRAWKHKTEIMPPPEDQFRKRVFGWEPVWIPLNEYLNNSMCYIQEETFLTKIQDEKV